MTILIIWIGVANLFGSLAVPDHFDVLEVNHLHDEWGRPRLTQLIFWDFDKGRNTHICQGYIVFKDCYVKTAEGEAEWDKRVEKALSGLTLMERAEARKHLSYAGDYHPPISHPVRQWRKKLWRSRFIDSQGIYRCITASRFWETKSQVDPEVADRSLNAVSNRRGLTKPR